MLLWDVLNSLLSSGRDPDGDADPESEARRRQLLTFKSEILRLRRRLRQLSQGEGAMRDAVTADIDEMLERARALAEGDSSRVLIKPAMGFDSELEAKHGLVLGGVPSPRLLMREPEGFGTEDRIPYTFTIPRPVLILAESLDGELEAWVPFLDALAQETANLLIVTGDIRNTGQLVRVLLLNTEHRVLRSGIAGLPEGWSLLALARRLAAATGKGEELFYLQAGESPGERSIKDLPFGERAYLRRDTSIVLPPKGADWSAVTRPIAVFSVGGRYAEDQQHRLMVATERRGMRRQRRHTTRAQLTALPQAPLLTPEPPTGARQEPAPLPLLVPDPPALPAPVEREDEPEDVAEVSEEKAEESSDEAKEAADESAG